MLFVAHYQPTLALTTHWAITESHYAMNAVAMQQDGRVTQLHISFDQYTLPWESDWGCGPRIQHVWVFGSSLNIFWWSTFTHHRRSPLVYSTIGYILLYIISIFIGIYIDTWICIIDIGVVYNPVSFCLIIPKASYPFICSSYCFLGLPHSSLCSDH